ncbi:hypothetical protein Ahy_B04g070184 isoform D [Arachis hypogaea]|uniref:SWIM-type domain-containing protein n=1 Tax=Arachis hypogaea TaxID=3818 RepID=A0A444ZFC4_ARAHY|nr:hypothetical protein Ahy_B04g070184 isoform D [Arachis hypogaea]
MRFEDLKLAQNFYATYAKKVGFVCKIWNTNLDRMTKEPINQSIHYNQEGFRGSRVKEPTRKNTVVDVGCRARIYAKFDREKKDWALLKVDLRHSHPCSTKKAVHYHENRESTMHAKCMIEVNDEAGIRPNKTFLALANEVGGPSNLGLFEKDVKNYISARLRSNNINADVKEMLDYFMRMKEMNPNFFYVVNVDDDYKFRSAVWVDARCRDSYEYYGDVVSFDTTYSTNQHGLPFATFVGVNHHGKSTLLGCALLGSEEIPSFDKFLLLGGMFCVDMFHHRHMWVPIFFKGQFWASMKSAQRSESMHSFFGGYLHSKTSLVQFVHEFDNVLGNKEQKELEDDAADSRGFIPCATSSTIERQFQQEYTNDIFRDVQTEFVKKADYNIRAVNEQGDLAWVKVEQKILAYEKTRYVTYNVRLNHLTHEVQCECNLFESAGVLCCHCLVVLSFYKVNKVPSCYILRRWSKKIKRKHTYINSSHDVRRSDESQNLYPEGCVHTSTMLLRNL